MGPRIVIPEPTSSNRAYNEKCWRQYAAAVEASGGVAVRIALDLSPSEVATIATSCSGILLPGSPADIEPQKYGQHCRPETAKADPAREAVDELLLQDAFNLHKPLFGICYGHQSMNVWKGGSLEQHLQTSVAHESPDGGKAEHPVVVMPAQTGGVFGEAAEFLVNSSHHQAVSRVGDGLAVAARCSVDGTIEAVTGTSPAHRFVLGVQWHPERSFGLDQHSERLFRLFVQAATKWHLDRQPAIALAGG